MNKQLPIFEQDSELLKQSSSKYLWENGESLIAAACIPSNGLVIDIGANEGQWSSMVLKQARPRIIHAFEPIPAVFECLCNNIAGSVVQPHNMAVSSDNGEHTFYYFTHRKRASQMSSLFPRNLERSPTTLQVPTITLDTFCTQQHITHIDFLKIDAEGSELEILKGAQTLLHTLAITYLQFEYESSFHIAGITLQEVINFLTTYGYKIFKIIPEGLVSLTQWDNVLENYEYANFLAVVPEVYQKRISSG